MLKACWPGLGCPAGSANGVDTRNGLIDEKLKTKPLPLVSRSSAARQPLVSRSSAARQPLVNRSSAARQPLAHAKAAETPLLPVTVESDKRDGHAYGCPREPARLARDRAPGFAGPFSGARQDGLERRRDPAAPPAGALRVGCRLRRSPPGSRRAAPAIRRPGDDSGHTALSWPAARSTCGAL